MKRLLKYYKEKKGISLVLIALLLAVLFMLAGLAIDISYMYYVKNQLQVAADAAALAGVALISNSNDLVQANARAEAIIFAAKNSAAGIPVEVITDNTNTLSDNNDITVGNWNATRDPKYLAGQTPVNAIEVRPQRVQGLSGSRGAVRVFIGQVFRLIGINWGYLSARASAIASRHPLEVGVSIAICLDTCKPGVIDPGGTLLYWAPYPHEVIPGNVGIAWTSFNTTSQATEKDKIISFFCGATQDVCNLTVYTSNGYNNDLARQFRCAFKNPLYDSDNKTCSDGACDSATDNVTSWSVLVPIFTSPDGCPPGDQPAPDTVVQYGKLNIIEVYASGSGGTSNCACGAYDADKLNGPNAILVNSIYCFDCNNPDIPGNKPVLVK
jgi:Flp pilus assembly protein TadG